MKKIIFLFFFLIAGLMSISAQTISLPNDCKQILNRNFKGWKFARVPKDVSDYHKESKAPFEPNLIKGDWNGDGKLDYAVLIEFRKTTKTIAFIRQPTRYKYYKLEGGDYLQVFKKGEKDYNYTSQKDFIYKNDSIFVGIGECCGNSFVWRNGKFIGIITSD